MTFAYTEHTEHSCCCTYVQII